MGLVVAADAVVDDLQLLGGGHAEAGEVRDARRHARHHGRLGVAQPRRLADAVVRRHQLARLRVVHRGPLELFTQTIFEGFFGFYFCGIYNLLWIFLN